MCVSELAESDSRWSFRLEDEGVCGFDVLCGRHADVEAQQDLDRELAERRGGSE